MAIAIDLSKKNIEVISSKDEAVQCSAEEYAEYLKTLDDAILNLKPDVNPTRFVLRKELPYDAAKVIKAEQASYVAGEVEVNMGHAFEVVRYALIDIKNPGGDELKFVKESGYASRELVAKLDYLGILDELYAAHKHSGQAASVKKKS